MNTAANAVATGKVGKVGKVGKLAGRAQAQRNRIIDAAEKCFIESGFHAASISDIAAKAEMSPGLMYRYFKNKNAIVKASIERCLEEECGELINRLESPQDVVEAILAAFERWCRMDDPKMNAALCLETVAEATRDAEIAVVTREASCYVRDRLQELIRRTTRASGVKLSARTLSGRTMILQCLIEGLMVRAIREPELDRAALKAELTKVILMLMQE
jgi:AcrR family transcriptional regulator